MTFSPLLPILVFLSRACLLTCESNEIPLDDCTDCTQSNIKTEIHTYSQPAWKAHLAASTPTTKKPDTFNQLHSTELVGTTNVVTHGVIHPNSTGAHTFAPGIETVEPKGYTTKTVKPSTKAATTLEQLFTTKIIPSTRGYTTKVIPTASTSHQNVVTTKSVNVTEGETPGFTGYNTAKFSPLYTGAFEVTTSEDPTTPESLTTENEVVTKKVTVKTEAVATTEPVEVVTTKEKKPTTPLATEAEPTEAEQTEAVPVDWEVDNEVDQDENKNADPEYCLDRDRCYNGGESVCERNGGDFLYCICQPGFTGTFCEENRSVAKVDDHDSSHGSFWDWKLSKYIIGALGALTVIGLIMLTCMVVVSKGL